MGLDIYAGTLTRYYSRNWKSATQKWAEENGLSYDTIRPDGETTQEEAVSADTIQTAVQEWSCAVANSLISPSGQGYEAWEENNEKDYFTDKPDWSAFGALLLYGACLKYKLPLPQKVKKDWDYQQDTIVVRALEDNELNWSLFSYVEWWLPFDDSFSFNCITPNECEVKMATTGTLLAELRVINENGWNADEAMILSWSETEGYPTDAEIVDNDYNKIADNDEYDVQSLAKFAFSIMYQAALFSEKHHVPILMDY